VLQEQLVRYQLIQSNIAVKILTIIPTLGAREIFLELWTRIILLVLSAVSIKGSVGAILFISCSLQYSHAHVGVGLDDLVFFVAIAIALPFVLLFAARVVLATTGLGI
jgi:hypothetical protein